jgi:hypothetical protein
MQAETKTRELIREVDFGWWKTYNMAKDKSRDTTSCILEVKKVNIDSTLQWLCSS